MFGLGITCLVVCGDLGARKDESRRKVHELVWSVGFGMLDQFEDLVALGLIGFGESEG